MIRYLRELWKALRRSTPDKTVTISENEEIARFIYQKSDWSKQPTPKPKPKVFLPMKEGGLYETSICRICNIPASRIWNIANRVRSPLPALAYADLYVHSIIETGLHVKSAPDIEADYPEHAAIVGWPDEKEKQMELAQQLSISAGLVQAPSSTN